MKFRKSLQKAIHKPPQWMQRQIDQDFSPFLNLGITRDMLDNLMAARRDDLLVRFKVQSGEISYFSSEHENNQLFLTRRDIVQNALKKLAKNVLLPNVEFIVSVADSNNNDERNLAPLFVFSKNRYFVGQILIPDTDALLGYNHFRKQIEAGEEKYPWEKKRTTGFWRGATTGGYYHQYLWKSYPRSKLVLLSLQYPTLIDAKFSHYLQGAELNQEMQELPELLGGFVSPKESLQYKYLIDIDGNSCSWSRLYWTLLSNSVVFKQVTDNVQWYYGALSPGIHYVPIKEDLSDLPEKISLAIKKDAKMKEIAKKATAFASENLSETMIYLYLYLVINHYAKLML